jgi:hypothetical protein
MYKSKHPKEHSMNLDEFEVQYRDQMDNILNQLQTAILLLADLERRTRVVGEGIQSISQTVEIYISSQRTNT